jgi:hypothetical protein
MTYDNQLMNIEEYKAKIVWYLAEEYMIADLEDMSRGIDELSDEVDNLVMSAYKKKKSIMVAARRLKAIIDVFTEK